VFKIAKKINPGQGFDIINIHLIRGKCFGGD
jgi:hypothetical protein